MNKHENLTERIRAQGNWDMRIPYALRRVPESSFACLLPCPVSPKTGDIALARLEKIGKNVRLELCNGRPCTLHEGDLLAVVFGNRYATEQFEAYARIDGDACDLLSMGGLCGLVQSKHSSVPEPSKLRILGAIGDADAQPLHLRDFALPAVTVSTMPHVVVVCGTSMDAGKTHTAMSLIAGLKRQGHRVAGIKLTGTAAGRDTWSFADAGACPALDFVDGGYPSTYLSTVEELQNLYGLLVGQAASNGANYVVIEIADGLFQQETSALLRSPDFKSRIDTWVFATGDPMGAAGGVAVLRGWGIEPVAISGLISRSPLAMREAQAATGINCLTAASLQRGELNTRLIRSAGLNTPNIGIEAHHSEQETAFVPDLKIVPLPKTERNGSDRTSKTSSRSQLAGMKRELLRRANILPELDNEQLEQFAEFMELEKVSQGTQIIKQGAKGEAMYVVLDGEVRVRQIFAGKETILAILSAGEFFGEIALLDHGFRSADAFASADSLLMKMSLPAFELVTKTSPELSTPFLTAISKTCASHIRADNNRYLTSVNYAGATGS